MAVGPQILENYGYEDNTIYRLTNHRVPQVYSSKILALQKIWVEYLPIQAGDF
jgi:hypothetical protein